MTKDTGMDPSSADFFEEKYRRDADPWNFSGSAYEQSRYDAIVAALRGRRYKRGFEPGCSIGALTERLAPLCEAMEAIDFAKTAVIAARERCPEPEITFRIMSLPDRLPVKGFDLIVLSEIGYYFTAEHWTEIVASLAQNAAPGTTLLAAHWLGVSPDHRMSGDQVHSILRAEPKLQLQHEERHPGFRLDRWERA